MSMNRRSGRPVIESASQWQSGLYRGETKSSPVLQVVIVLNLEKRFE